jgi:predicted N-acetyltransferase YhbS
VCFKQRMRRRQDFFAETFSRRLFRGDFLIGLHHSRCVSRTSLVAADRQLGPCMCTWCMSGTCAWVQTISRPVAKDARAFQSRKGLHSNHRRSQRKPGDRLLRTCADGDHTVATPGEYTDRPTARSCPLLALGPICNGSNWAGKGVGTGLLKHALQRCVTAAALIGGRALIVNAVDAEAAAFWGRCGFIPSKDDTLVLFRSIGDIAASSR